MILPSAVVALALAAAPSAFDVRAFGARGDGRTDDSRALQAALDAAREAGGGVVYLPAGTYVVAPPRASGAGVSTASLTIGSRTWLRGDGAATVLKVKDGAGSYRALFSSHPTPQTPAEDVTLSDLRVDQNCAASGGKVGPGGGDFIVWLAWGGRNLSVERVRFDPICGVNTVVLNAPAARNLTVRDSTFRFVKGPTDAPGGEYDNSAIYVHGRGTVVTGNHFEAELAAGARGAIELHGAAGVAANNVTRGYRACVRVVGTSEKGEPPPAPGNGFSVTGNACLDANDAINIWGITGHGVRDVTITGNTITLAQLDHLAAQPAIEHASGIAVVWDASSGALAGDVRGLVIEGNTISAQPSRDRARKGAYSSAGIALAPMGSLSDVVVRGNVLRDLPARGIWVEAKGRGARTSRVRIEGNVLVDPGHDPSAGKHRAGIAVAGLLEDVEVAHNTVAASRAPAGVDAVRVLAAGGSARVGVHDNAWSTAEGREGWRLAVEGPVDAGPAGRARAVRVARGDGPLTLDASTARTWDLCFGAPGPFTVRGPTGAVAGQRLTIRIRNDSGGRLAPLRWEGFRMAPFTPPGPRASRVVEVEWDGGVWREVYQSAGDVPE